jgi:hypothetical protein
VILLTAGAADPRLDALCKAMPACRPVPIPGARAALHLEADPWRAPWLAAVSDTIARKVDLARDPEADGDSSEGSEASDDTPHPTP